MQKKIMTNEKLLNVLKNSDEHFDCSVESYQRNEYSANEDYDNEFNKNQNNNDENGVIMI